MTKPFKFRYVNEIAGTFVLLVLVALVAGVLAAARAQRWFEPVYRLTLEFPEEGSFGLQVGGEVQILGTTVGAVDQILIEEDGTMSAEISIRGDFIRFVREDSRGIVKKKFGVAGDAFVHITKGSGRSVPKTGAVLTCTKDIELMETLAMVVDQVRSAILPMIEQTRAAAAAYTGVAEDLRDPKGNLQQLLANLNSLTAGLQQGEGLAGQLLRDPGMAKEVQEITRKLNQTMTELEAILADLRQASGKLPDMAETIGNEVDDLPGMALQTQQALRETTALIEAIQQHWLIRKYVDQSDPTTRISPSQVMPAEPPVREGEP